MKRALHPLLTLAVAFAATSSAYAQEEEPPPAEPVLTPPSLLQGAEGELPEGTLEEGETREVVLRILITPEGEASEVEVVEGLGEPFDAAAIEAAGRFRFQAATRDGEPIPARIQFRFVFRGPEPPPPPPPSGALELEVFHAGEAIEGALVLVFTLDEEGEDIEEELRARTDAGGGVGFDQLPPGPRRLIVSAEGYETLERQEEIVDGEAVELRYTLVAEASEEEDEPDAELDIPELSVTAVVERPRREVTRRTLPREVLTQMPGTRGDALRVVELLPGVARPSFGSGALRVRGAAPGDSEVFVDGVSVPLLYHFGGLTSFYNSRLLERIDFYPGNFSVRYGRRIGGILEVEPRDPSPDRNFHGVADINVLDGSLMIETPLWDGASLALAARRSWVDFFFEEVVPDGLFDVVAAPVYYDYQLIFTWRPGRDDRLRLLVYGSSDEFRTVFSGEDFGRSFGLQLSTQFHRAQASWRHDYDGDFRQDVTFAGGWTGTVVAAGEAFSFDAEFVPLTFRSEWTLALHEDVQVRWGIDMQFTPVSLAFRGPAPAQSEGSPGNGGTPPQAQAAITTAAYRPAIYVESSLNPIDPLTLVLGLRLDYFQDIQEWTFDPRVSARVALSEQWAVKAGIGLFSQAPEFQESAEGLGNPNLDPITAVHSSAGVELRYDETWRFELEGYYKHIWRRVTGTEGGLPPFFDNEGTGRIYGAELSIRAEPTPDYPIFGFLSYTLSRSERRDRDGQWRLFDFDQTHILSLALVWRIGDGWQAGATFRLVSGNPITPVNGSVYDVTAGTYRPIYGAVNSARGDPFHRLDLRLEKVFNIENVVRLAIYVDVQNVYNNMNPEAVRYSFDYAESGIISGLPILPSLGIRGEL